MLKTKYNVLDVIVLVNILNLYYQCQMYFEKLVIKSQPQIMPHCSGIYFLLKNQNKFTLIIVFNYTNYILYFTYSKRYNKVA